MSVKTETKNNQPEDWHKADIIAALHKKGWSIRQLAFFHGYKNPSTLSQALHRPFPKGEKIIAAALDEKPENIWGARFFVRNQKKVYG